MRAALLLLLALPAAGGQGCAGAYPPPPPSQTIQVFLANRCFSAVASTSFTSGSPFTYSVCFDGTGSCVGPAGGRW